MKHEHCQSKIYILHHFTFHLSNHTLFYEILCARYDIILSKMQMQNASTTIQLCYNTLSSFPTYTQTHTHRHIFVFMLCSDCVIQCKTTTMTAVLHYNMYAPEV